MNYKEIGEEPDVVGGGQGATEGFQGPGLARQNSFGLVSRSESRVMVELRSRTDVRRASMTNLGPLSVGSFEWRVVISLPKVYGRLEPGRAGQRAC